MCSMRDFPYDIMLRPLGNLHPSLDAGPAASCVTDPGSAGQSSENRLCVPDVLLSAILIHNKTFNPCYTVFA